MWETHPAEHPTATYTRFFGGWIHSERNNHSSVMVGDLPNTSQFNPYNITSSLSPWPYTIPLPYSLALINPTESWPNCNPIMEIEFWLQIGEISHAEIKRDGSDLTCWLGTRRATTAQVSLSPRWRAGPTQNPTRKDASLWRNAKRHSAVLQKHAANLHSYSEQIVKTLISSWPILWNRILFEKLTVAHLLKIFSSFTEPPYLLPSLQ